MRSFYTQISHTSDIGIVVYAPSIPELYINSAKALFDLILGLENINSNFQKEIEIQGLDEIDLLIRWLNDLIYLFSVRKFVFKEFKIMSLSSIKLLVRSYGEVWDSKKHNIKREIKAATYHNVEIQKKDSLYQTRVIFDI